MLAPSAVLAQVFVLLRLSALANLSRLDFINQKTKGSVLEPFFYAVCYMAWCRAASVLFLEVNVFTFTFVENLPCCLVGITVVDNGYSFRCAGGTVLSEVVARLLLTASGTTFAALEVVFREIVPVPVISK